MLVFNIFLIYILIYISIHNLIHMGYKTIENREDCKVQVYFTEEIKDRLLVLSNKKKCSLSTLCKEVIIKNLIEKS